MCENSCCSPYLLIQQMKKLRPWEEDVRQLLNGANWDKIAQLLPPAGALLTPQLWEAVAHGGFSLLRPRAWLRSSTHGPRASRK